MEDCVETVSENMVVNTKSVDLESLLNEKLETSSGTKSIEDLRKEEKFLKGYLEKLKKENVSLQANINASHLTLEKKLEEFNQTKLNLNGVHQEIWSEREVFCTKAKEFNDEFGVLSNWWKAQLNFVCELENLRLGKKEEEDRKNEIEFLQREMFDLKKEIEELEELQNITTADVHSSGDGDSYASRSDESLSKTVSEKDYSKNEDENPGEDGLEKPSSEFKPENFMFSMMNLNRVREAREKRKNRKKKKINKLEKFPSELEISID